MHGRNGLHVCRKLNTHKKLMKWENFMDQQSGSAHLRRCGPETNAAVDLVDLLLQLAEMMDGRGPGEVDTVSSHQETLRWELHWPR